MFWNRLRRAREDEMADTPATLPGFGARLRRNLPFFAIELLVVFVGVYLAFLLGNRREAAREFEVAMKYRDSLICDFEMLISSLGSEEEKLRRHLQVVREIEQGLEPDIPVDEFYYLHDDLVLQAGFDSQNFESLDERLVTNLTRGRFALHSVEQPVARLNSFMDTVLLPMMRSGDRRYYDAQGKLLPHLEAYPRLIRGTFRANLVLQQIVQGDALPSLKLERLGVDMDEALGMEQEEVMEILTGFDSPCESDEVGQTAPQ